MFLLLLSCATSSGPADTAPAVLIDDIVCWEYISIFGCTSEVCGDLRACCEDDVCWYETRGEARVYTCKTRACGGDADVAGLGVVCGALTCE